MFLFRAPSRRNVLFAMANPRSSDTEAREPGFSEHARNVHGVVPDRLLPGKEAMYSLQRRLPCRCHINMLQRDRQLFVLGHSVRRREV